MFNKLSNKELVTVTHDLAKTLSADAQFLDVAKLLAESATRLDVALTRANELLRKAEEAEALMLAMRDDSIESRSKLELITAEFAAIKSGPLGFFSYGTDSGFEEHDTAEKAMLAADSDIDYYRGDACDGWSEETDRTVWGVILQRATMTGLRAVTEEDRCDPSIKEWCDYTLLPAVDTPATDAMVNEIRAEGVELFAANQIRVAERHDADNRPVWADERRISADQAESFANQLRADAAKGGE